MNDQVNKADGGKSNPLLLEQDLAGALYLVNRVLDYGAEKYERAGWKTVESERYDQAARRHKRSRDCGELIDDESGLFHLAHEATNILFQLQMEIEKASVDLEFLGAYNKPPQDHKEEKEEEPDDGCEDCYTPPTEHAYTAYNPPPLNSRHWKDLQDCKPSGDVSVLYFWVKLRHYRMGFDGHGRICKVVAATWLPRSEAWVSNDPTVDLDVWQPIEWMEMARE